MVGNRSEVSALSTILAEVERALHNDLCEALRLLNEPTPYRFTGIYRFESGVVKSVALYDRENPACRIGADVPWFDSYCMMTAENGGECEIQHSLNDPRLTGHAARLTVMSYCAVLLRTADGEPLGTLCHYDVLPRETRPGTVEDLRTCRAVVERTLWERLDIRRQSA